jgi:hypothetical protein
MSLPPTGSGADAVTTAAPAPGHRPPRASVRSALPEHPATAITPRELARQLGPVLADLPLFLVSPLRRRRHRTWGATPYEVAATMPGDQLRPRAQYRSTRAITVAAPPEEIWPWLVQVGYRRAGWYANDLLDNFARPSAREIHPELQDLHVGQWLAWVPWPSERSAFVVDSYLEPEWLVWRSPNRSWCWRLVPLSGGRTRLISRLNTEYEWSRPLVLGTVLLMEVADYPMMRRMLRGIRTRAEGRPQRLAR